MEPAGSPAGRFDGPANFGHNVGRMLVQLRQQQPRREQEDSAVPQEAPVGDIASGGRRIGLFDETLRPKGAGRHRFPLLDVTVAGFGPIRPYSERDQPTLLRGLRAGRDRSLEGGRVLHDMVARQNQHQIGRMSGVECCHRDRGCGAPRKRLEDKTGTGNAGLFEL
jgi:hypothetical protein